MNDWSGVAALWSAVWRFSRGSTGLQTRRQLRPCRSSKHTQSTNWSVFLALRPRNRFCCVGREKTLLLTSLRKSPPSIILDCYSNSFQSNSQGTQGAGRQRLPGCLQPKAGASGV